MRSWAFFGWIWLWVFGGEDDDFFSGEMSGGGDGGEEERNKAGCRANRR